ncbi:hypothetical protein [Ostreibacterium oceani]|nr:hypothetical protein [Ostreibacterium oceani]
MSRNPCCWSGCLIGGVAMHCGYGVAVMALRLWRCGYGGSVYLR